MSHLQLVSDNRNVQHPFRMRREREERRAQLGMVGISGGRLLPMVIPQPVPETVAASTSPGQPRV